MSAPTGASWTPTSPPATAALAKVSVYVPVAVLEVGKYVHATALGFDAQGVPVPLGAVVFESSAPSIATVDASGTIAGLVAGKAAVRATTGGISGTDTVTVIPTLVSRVDVIPSALTLDPGMSRQLAAVTSDFQGGVLDGRPVTWSSSDATIVSVGPTGLVTAIQPGTAKVSATSGDRSGGAIVTVTGQVATTGGVIVSIAAPSQGQVIKDSLVVLASVRAQRPLAHVFARVGADSIEMVLKPVGALGANWLWSATFDLFLINTGTYYAVVRATDTQGASAADSVIFERNPQLFGGGGKPPTGNKLVAPPQPARHPTDSSNAKP